MTQPRKAPWIGYKGGQVAHAGCDAAHSASVENRHRMPLTESIHTYHPPAKPCAWCKAPVNGPSPWRDSYA